MSRLLALLGLLLLLSSRTGAQTPLTVQAFFFHGLITSSVAMDALKYLDGKRSVYYLAFDTPGGVIPAGELVMDRMKELQRGGASIKCIAIGECMSMGLYIYNTCDTLAAYSDAKFMFHEAMAEGQMTVRDMKRMIKELEQDQDRLDPPLLTRLGVTREEFLKHRNLATEWKVEDLLKWAPKYPIKVIQREVVK
jgi:ATP-dependent protease ClpP protease subunit